MMRIAWFAALLVSWLLFACSGCEKNKSNSNNYSDVLNNTNNGSDTLNNTNNNPDAVNNTNNLSDIQDAGPDADTVEPECIPGLTQCSDCVDNDGNGLVDGFDPTCVSPSDRTEGSFTTEIPGDGTNTDFLDCWFDGNSGGGDDNCRVHICCMLDECPAALQSRYVPEDCATDLSQRCIESCLQYVVPGCDCFGCCTVCSGGECHDIFIGTPMNFPSCTLEEFSNPAVCPPCHLNEGCANPCHPENCELCPGMTEADLPPECQNSNTCPGGATPCSISTECAPGYTCSVGCCVPYVQ